MKTPGIVSFLFLGGAKRVTMAQMFRQACRDLFGKTFNGRTINNGSDLAMYLLEEAHVATVDGAAFSAPGYIRLSYATSDENLVEAFRRIREKLA